MSSWIHSIRVRELEARHGDAPTANKRVIKLLKDIYSKSDDRSMQAQIAGSILSRITDEEHSVRVSFPH